MVELLPLKVYSFTYEAQADLHHVYLYSVTSQRNKKDLKVKPATSFKYFQYLLTNN